MANGERDYEYIQVGGKQGLTPMPTGQVTNTPMPTDIVQGGALNQLINDSQGAGVVQATGGQVQPTVNEIYPEYATGYDPLATDPTVQAYDPLIAAQRGATSPGALPQTTYTPGINRPITAGGYSGRVIGNTTFFAPQGQVVPLGIIDAREKAMQEAAMKAAELEQKKAAKQAELNAWEVPTSPQLNDKNYQRQYNKEFNTFINESIDEAKKLYGDNWRQAIKDPTNALGRDFQQKMARFQYIAERGNQITDKLAQWMTDFDKGDIYLSPRSRQLVEDAYNRVGDFSGSDITDLYGLEREVQKSVDLDKFLNDNKMVTNGMMELVESYKKSDGSVDYDAFTKTGKASIDAKAKEMASYLYNNRFAGGPYTEQDIYESIKSRFGDQVTKDMKTVSTPGASGYFYDKKKEMEGAIVKYDQYNNAQVAGDVDKKSKTGYTIKDGYIVVDGKRVPFQINPSDEVKLSQIEVRKTDENGMPVTDANGNPVYENVTTWGVSRTEFDESQPFNSKETKVNYVVYADSEGDSKGYLKGDHTKEYNASQKAAEDAGVISHSTAVEGSTTDPNRNAQGADRRLQMPYQGKGNPNEKQESGELD